MHRFAGSVMTLCLVLAVGGWKGCKTTPEEKSMVRRAVLAWLECEECSDGELEAVVKVGSLAVSSLAAALVNGPSPVKREMHRRHLIATYTAMKDNEKADPSVEVPMSMEEFLKTYLERYDSLHRSRAITALAAIGNDEARRVLREARSLPLNSSLREHLESTLRTLK